MACEEIDADIIFGAAAQITDAPPLRRYPQLPSEAETRSGVCFIVLVSHYILRSPVSRH